MRSSAEKLRWVFLGGALLLAAVLAAIFGMANYRAGKIWQRILARNGVNLQRETNGFTYSQSDGKRTVFTLHAAKAIPHGNNNYTLHDAVLILYTKDGRTDRIYGNQFEYDQGQGLARAFGEVHMDLEAPAAAGAGGHAAVAPDLSFTPEDEAAADPALIHVRTSGLVYSRKQGVATTDQPAEFRYKGLTCTSLGAEFDSGQNVLRLLADVQMTGLLRNAPFTLTASRADLDRVANTANLMHPFLVSGRRNARAAHALLHLRADGSLETGDGDGGVELRSGTETIAAPTMHGDFAAQNRPEHALLSGGVTFTDSNGRRPAQGAAKTVDLTMDAAGTLKTAVAEGGATLLVKDTTVSGPVLTRQLRAQRVTAGFVPDGLRAKRSVLRTLHMTGAAEFSGESPAKVVGEAPALTRVVADDLTTTFVAGNAHNPQPQRMAGFGHTRFSQTGAAGAHGASTGDALQVSFAQRLGAGAKGGGTLEVASAVQTGHVELQSWSSAARASAGGLSANAPVNPAENASTGHAQQAVFEASAGTLTLTGGAGNSRAEIDDGQTQMFAPTIVLHQGTGDGEASGGVETTTDGRDGSPATHVLAARAALLHGAGLTQFFGSDEHPARLWQGGSQVQAATVVLDGAHHTLSARPQNRSGAVNAVFTSARGAPGTEKPAGTRGKPVESVPGQGRRDGAHAGQALGGNAPEASRDTVEVRAAAMDFNDLQHEATFGGDVLIRATEGTITGDHGAAFLEPPAPSASKPLAPATKNVAPGPPTPATLGGRLERFVVLGDVRLKQPGRTGDGEQLTYTAATNSFVLTGTASAQPRIHDAQQGLVTGATLLFGAADSSIVVAATQNAGKQAKPARVHTETDLKPQ